MRSIVTVVMLVVLSVGVSPLTAVTQSVETNPSAKPLVTYFETIYRPVIEGRTVSTDTLRLFYDTSLSLLTRIQITEEQFINYWGGLEQQGRRIGYSARFQYTLSEPIPSEAGDQALILAKLMVKVEPTLGHQLFAFFLNLVGMAGCAAPLPGRQESCSEAIYREGIYHPEGASDRLDVVYGVVQEEGAWKVALPAGVIEIARRVTPQVSRKRHAPYATATARGVTVRVPEVVLSDESTTLRAIVDNASSTPIYVQNTFSLATLTDDRGRTYMTRILRSRFPNTLAGGESAAVTLAFEPLPLEARRFVLDLPGFRVVDDEFALRLEISLEPRAAPLSPIPGEPVLLYLLTISRSSSKEQAAIFYQRHLSTETRANVNETVFVNYATTRAQTDWGQKIGPGPFPWLLRDFTMGDATYGEDRRAATIRVETKWEKLPCWFPPCPSRVFGPGPAKVDVKMDVTLFHVVKEDGTWKLVLDPDLFPSPR